LGGEWQATGQLAHSERAPSDAELFANGQHMATHTWETGNPALGLEKSNNIELGLERRTGPHPIKFSVYESRFSNFIGLMATGRILGTDALPEYAYAGVRARLRGWEASGQSRSPTCPRARWTCTWQADRVLDHRLPIERLTTAKAHRE